MSVPVITAPCAICSNALEARSSEHGFVWVCRACRAVAANLAVIRKIAPRQFVKYLWLAALESGVASRHPCPSCQQPLLDLGPEVEVSPPCKVCCRCFLIWFDQESVGSLGISSNLNSERLDVLGRARRVIGPLARALSAVAS